MMVLKKWGLSHGPPLCHPDIASPLPLLFNTLVFYTVDHTEMSRNIPLTFACFYKV